MLKTMNIDNPTHQQKEEAERKAIVEHHTILFMLVVDKYKYGKLIEEMKNDVIRITTHSLKPSQRHLMYYQNGKITTDGNTTTIKVNPMMVLAPQL